MLITYLLSILQQNKDSVKEVIGAVEESGTQENALVFGDQPTNPAINQEEALDLSKISQPNCNRSKKLTDLSADLIGKNKVNNAKSDIESLNNIRLLQMSSVEKKSLG